MMLARECFTRAPEPVLGKIMQLRKGNSTQALLRISRDNSLEIEIDRRDTDQSMVQISMKT